MLRTLTLVMVASLCLAPMAHAKKDKKKNKNAPPPVGWHAEEGWAGECWFPPNFDEMGPGDRRMAWQETREQIMGQWSGNKGRSTYNKQHTHRERERHKQQTAYTQSEKQKKQTALSIGNINPDI